MSAEHSAGAVSLDIGNIVQFAQDLRRNTSRLTDFASAHFCVWLRNRSGDDRLHAVKCIGHRFFKRDEFDAALGKFVEDFAHALSRDRRAMGKPDKRRIAAEHRPAKRDVTAQLIDRRIYERLAKIGQRFPVAKFVRTPIGNDPGVIIKTRR